MEHESKKKKYEEAILEVTELKSSDIVTTSDTSLDPDGNYDDKAWT